MPADCRADAFREVPDADPSDPVGCSGHGTQVAGVLGAAANNGIGSAGVAANARLIALRSCYDSDTCWAHVQGNAFRFAAQNGARVVSLSWTQGINQDQLAAIAASPNTLFVTIPGGNGGAFDAEANPDLPYPCTANLPNILCVTTAAPNDGLDCGPYGATIVDIAVPTQGIIAPVNGGGTLQGGCATSYASPIAAGVATILFGLVPQATPAQVKAAIMAGARPAPAWQGKSVTGGVLDAVGAVDALQAQYGLSPPLQPNPPVGITITKGKGPAKKTTKKKAKLTWTSAVANAGVRLQARPREAEGAAPVRTRSRASTSAATSSGCGSRAATRSSPRSSGSGRSFANRQCLRCSPLATDVLPQRAPLPVDDAVAPRYGRLVAEARRLHGARPRLADALIAATAIAHRLPLYARDRDFERIPGPELVLV